MRDSTKRFTVAVAGVALAGGAVLASAPAAEAATVAGHTVTVDTSVHGATAAGWDRDDDDHGRHEYRGHHGGHHGGYWKRHHYKKRYWGGGHHRRHHHRWYDHGRYGSYREAYLMGERYRGSSWESFQCYQVGGYYVLRVIG